MSLSLSRSKRTLAILPLCALLAGACVKPDAPGIKVNPIEASLVFGIKEKPPAAPSTPFDPPSFDEGASFDDFEFEPVEPPPDLTVVVKPQEFCPKAPPTASVKTPTEVDITGDPLQGIARWKVDGYVEDEAGNRINATRRYEGRIVRNFREVPPDADPRYSAGDKVHTFEMVNPAIGGGLVIRTFEIRTTSLQNRPGAPAGPVQPPTVGQPERGVALKKIEYVDTTGSLIGQTWSPPSGLLMLPLPVTSGESFQSSAVDPKDGRTITINAAVQFRSRIDACGDLVDGWLVEAEMYDTRQSTAELTKWSFIIATQFGGQMISETYKVGGQAAIFELGQLEPKPL